MKTYYKDPDAVLDYSFDWSNWLGSDVIDSSSWTISSEDLTKVSTTIDGGITTVWLSGGVAGKRYLIMNHIKTQGSREEDRSFVLEMTER